MIDNNDFLPEWLNDELVSEGFSEETSYVYGVNQTIRPEIVAKYGELTDDGYYELTKDGGGRLEFNEVYHNVRVILPYSDRYSHYCLNGYTPAIMISEAVKWLDGKGIYITPRVSGPKSDLEWWYEIAVYSEDGETWCRHVSEGEYKNRNLALTAGIEEVLGIIKKADGNDLS